MRAKSSKEIKEESPFVNSGRFLFTHPPEKVKPGILYITVPPIRMYDKEELVRVWVTPSEKKMIDEVQTKIFLTGILIDPPYNLPSLHWGDEVQFSVAPGKEPEIDLVWMSGVLKGKIIPEPKELPSLPSRKGFCKKKERNGD